MQELKIRKFNTKDTEDLAKLFFDSVRHGAKDLYTSAQRQAWAPKVPDTDVWENRLASLITYVAEDAKGVAGFMTVDEDGHIDLAYVRPDSMGKGVAYTLYQAIEKTAKDRNLSRLYTEASDFAKPFFERQAWELVETQEVQRHGILLRNHRMEKHLKS
ncbi:MAG: GNAT family N-acetyltransferase [Pseudohongiellaceae bacterium]